MSIILDTFRNLIHMLRSKIYGSTNTPHFASNINQAQFETLMMLMAKNTLAARREFVDPVSLADVEFKVFSQWGDDGIIQYIIRQINISSNRFIEFGVENYLESNTRFLLMNNNWEGLVIDGSKEHISFIHKDQIYWKYSLIALHAFVTRENINELILNAGFEGNIGLLHIDVDGNDYWIWDAIHVVQPDVVIMEYNSLFGIDRPITIPYKADFIRAKAHYSNLYAGASLKALYDLAIKKGYSFIGCNSAGNNAYFVKKEKLNNVKEISLKEGFAAAKFREARDKMGKLTCMPVEKSKEVLRGMPVYNVSSEQIEPF